MRYSNHREHYVVVSDITGCFCFLLDRLHRQELKATWSRLNRQSGGTVIPGGGPVTKSSVSIGFIFEAASY